MMGGFGMMAGAGWLGLLTTGLFWIGIILLAVWGVSVLFPTTQRTTGLDALEILKQRYARGEISREEFEHTRMVLRGQ